MSQCSSAFFMSEISPPRWSRHALYKHNMLVEDERGRSQKHMNAAC